MLSTLRTLSSLATILCLWGASTSSAGVFERLVMPGALIRGHAKYENDCDKCHESFKKNSQRRLCLACHEKVARDIDMGSGYHGRAPTARATECKHCHTDHEGREARVVLLDAEAFDHRTTDFPLDGRHRSVPCSGCHLTGKPYRDAPGTCVTCHRKTNPHQKTLGDKCASCHGSQDWTLARYDHGKSRFPLTGKHRKVACDLCHPARKYDRSVPLRCMGCHALDDKHAGTYGQPCAPCHTTRGWKTPKTDHAKVRFALVGKHKKAPCVACHPENRYKKTPKACIACHEPQDIHEKRYGDKCDACHGSDGWKPSIFDHGKTKYPLEGQHEKVLCDGCHTGIIREQKLGSACYPCHRGDDLHRGRYKKSCERCHIVDGWRPTIFDHGKTGYPLRWKHGKVACDTCHRTPVGKPKLDVACVACHLSDDTHRGRYGRKCQGCHPKPDEWKQPAFDHDKTRYPLEKKHRNVPCVRCHREPISPSAPVRACVACHEKGDVHQGQEGKNCRRCHDESGWITGASFDHDLTRFPMIGMHAVATCEACHTTARYRDAPLACIDCHQDQDVHRQGLGRRCDPCHNPNDWRIWQFDHDRQTKYPLEGAHAGLACSSCHREPVVDKARLPKACNGCHGADDPHRGAFGRRCNRCHVVDSFKEIRLPR